MDEKMSRVTKGEIKASAVGVLFGLALLILGVFFVSSTWTDAFAARNKQLCTDGQTQGCVIKEAATMVGVRKVVHTEFDPMECAVDIVLKDGTFRKDVGVTQAICDRYPKNVLMNEDITIHRWGKDTLLEVTIDSRAIQVHEGPRYTMMFSVLGAWLGYLFVLACTTRMIYYWRAGKAPRPSFMLWTATVLLVAVITGLIINVSPHFAVLLVPLAVSMAVFELYVRQTQKWNER